MSFINGSWLEKCALLGEHSFGQDFHQESFMDTDTVVPASDPVVLTDLDSQPLNAFVGLAAKPSVAEEFPSGSPWLEPGSAVLKPAEGTAILLDALWPSPELVHQLGVKTSGGTFQNIPVKSAAQASQLAAIRSPQGDDCYFACAEYGNALSRTAQNVVGAAAFWFDLDCGEAKALSGKGYLDATTAFEALQSFMVATSLPAPTHLVNSGGGLHVYWVLDEQVAKDTWQVHAKKLKDLTHCTGLLADDSRTADIASVMRLPGTLNHKYSPPLPVVLLEKTDRRILQGEMLAAVTSAHQSLCPQLQDRPSGSKVNALTKTLAQKPSAPPNVKRLSSALATLDPDCDDDTWKLKRLAPLARAGREHPALAAALRSLAMSWSSGELRGEPAKKWATPSTSNGASGENVFDTVWRRFSENDYIGNPATLGTIFHDAQKVGWVDKNEDAFSLLIKEGEAGGDALRQSEAVLMGALAATQNGDVGAPFQEQVLDSLRVLRDGNLPAFQRARRAFKDANPQIALGAIDAAMKKKADADAHDGLQTHHAYAKATIEDLTVDGWPPRAYEGELYTVEEDGGLWVAQEFGKLERLVAEQHDGKENCERRGDYTGIAQQTLSIAGSDEFFADAPVGLACPAGFYTIVDNQFSLQELTPAHRQRVRIDFTPKQDSIPMFDSFVHQTFKSDVDGEEQQQRAVVQEVAGAIMLGLMPRHQKAVLFYDPLGRSGKGTLMDVLKALVPPSFIKAVSPFDWKKEYYVVSLAGLRLNVVGELTEKEPIPASIFKAVIGGDSITGRNPTRRPITFKNQAAHVFMSNHIVNTADHTEAFFARWIIVEFPNSLLRSGKPQDPDLAGRMIRSELPGIAYWALEGAKRLIGQGRFTRSIVHDRLMEKWRRSASSLLEFIHECCHLGPNRRARRKGFYAGYVFWCKQSGRKNSFSKQRVKELLEQNVGLGVTLVENNGYETFKGLELNEEWTDIVAGLDYPKM